MNTVAAFILIVSSWTATGPVITMQEFTSRDSCQDALAMIEAHSLPPGNRVLMRCVAK